MVVLALAFAVTAVLYAMVGFGGGSTYNALLVLGDTPYGLVPAIALICNILVVTGGTFRFARGGHLQWRRVMPFLLASVPAAFIGGRIAVSEIVFIALLGAALLFAGLQLLFTERKEEVKLAQGAVDQSLQLSGGQFFLSGFAGAMIGVLSGIVGIGGGIFLAPVLYALRINGTHWGGPKQIAAASSLFILANSIAGLIGQILKLSSSQEGVFALVPFWPLFIAVFIGGQAGSLLGSTRLRPSIICRMTAVLILYVAIRLLWRLAVML